MPKKPVLPEDVDIDDLTPEQIQARVGQTLEHIEAIKALWPGLLRLEQEQRKRTVGRNLSVLGPPLRLLFDVLRPKDGKESALAKAFHVLGDQDEGQDPERLEVDLLERRLVRSHAEQQIADALEDLARHIDDDVLATGEAVLTPGLAALALARTIAQQNPGHRTALAPVLDAFREMTKHARRSKKTQG